MIGSYRVVSFAFLVALGILFLAWRGLAYRVAGFQPFGTIGADGIDEPAALDERDAPRFLAQRNRLDLEVPRDMTLIELLRLYQIDFPHVRRQIAEQEGTAALADDAPLSAGQIYNLTLTPPAESPP